MASSSGGGGGGGGPHPSASSPAASLPSASPSSLDGGFLLRLLQNPPPQPRGQTPTPPQGAPSGPPHHFFVDPAVAAMGPLFPASQQVQGGGFAWPSPSAPQQQMQPQQQLRFPDPRFAPPVDPYAAGGAGGFGAADAVRAERPRPGAPPPGFGKLQHHTAGNREPPNVFGGMPNREQNPHHPRGFGSRVLNKELQTTETASQGTFGVLGQNPHKDPYPAITAGRDAGGMMYREQRQDAFLSRTPPEMNANRQFGRMPYGESHTLPSAGGRTLHGDQHMPPITGARMLPNGQLQLDPRLEHMPQREPWWQGHREAKGLASQKMPNADVRDVYGKVPMQEMHHRTLPTGSSVPVDVRGDRVNGLDEGGIRELGLEHGTNGGVIAEARKLEVSSQNSEIRFVGQDDDGDDDGREHDVMIEQSMENLVITDNSEAKGMELQKSAVRNKDFRSDFSRGHNVSSQRIRLQRRNRPCRYDIDRFTPGFLSIFESLVPSEEEIAKQRQLFTTLSRLINKEWPNSRLFVYGSCANSFGFSNSDIDLCLSIDDKEMSKVDIILKLAEILEAGNLQNIQALTRARVPIVKLMDPETGLSCDICVNNLLAVVNTKLLKDYSQIDRRLRQLAFIVKHWAKSRRVNETYQGTLSSYAYVIMCIHLLQLRRILPCLQVLSYTSSSILCQLRTLICVPFTSVKNLSHFNSVYIIFDIIFIMISGKATYFFNHTFSNLTLPSNDTVSRLLWAFFHYWAYEHDYTRDVISIRTGRIISKERKDWTRRVGNDRHLICIEDPFETSHDLGRVVDKVTIKILREEFERAANILQFDPNPSVTLFEPYIPPPPLPILMQEQTVSTTEIAQ
ncbi:hypothetical protein EJB05_22930, partial [Eragrostis curvula]